MSFDDSITLASSCPEDWAPPAPQRGRGGLQRRRSTRGGVLGGVCRLLGRRPMREDAYAPCTSAANAAALMRRQLSLPEPGSISLADCIQEHWCRAPRGPWRAHPAAARRSRRGPASSQGVA